MIVIDQKKVQSKMKSRIYRNQFFKYFFFSGTLICLLVLVILFTRILIQGFPYLDWQFLNSLPSRKPEEAGIYTALNGTIWLMAVVAPVTLILGVGTAIYLEEYARKK